MHLSHTDTVDYLGFILSLDGLTVDLAKIASIQDWLEPQKVGDIQSFLGFANFYQRFIPYYSDITIPLTCCHVEECSTKNYQS